MEMYNELYEGDGYDKNSFLQSNVFHFHNKLFIGSHIKRK